VAAADGGFQYWFHSQDVGYEFVIKKAYPVLRTGN
jgi:hypothetical protein